MVRRIRLLLKPLMLGVLMSGGAPGAVSAQSASDARLAEIFSGLGPEDPVQVITPSFFVEDAFVTSVGEGEVGLTQNGTNVDIGFIDIRGVSVQTNHWLQGTVWGTSAGLLIGGLAGMMWGSFQCTNPVGCIEDERAGMWKGAAIGGATGAFTGFMFGRHSVYWRPIFP